MVPAKLVLETGEIFHGISPSWQQEITFGEVVFNTGMVGYPETMTDPSYNGQLITFTYPLLGNYGVGNCESWESAKIHAKGIIVSELSPHYARSNAEQSLLSWCEAENVPIITNIDTRALTKCLREKGVVAGAITTADELPKAFPDNNARNLVAEVSIKEPEIFGSGDKLIIAVDCGMKENIIRELRSLPVRIKRVPYNYDYTNEHFDGVFISNGPGNPARCYETTNILRKAMDQEKPIFGICLGSQLMGLAINATTYKLRFGHRSQNQPCLQEGTDRCFLTSQNHGYAINEDSLPEGWRVSFRNLNDNTVQGIEHKTKPFFSVQFHPEAAPGPVDTHWLFNKFYQLIREGN
ncbi:glutamine-hydrolyzing carbamoyl-phosphate synthase small subunit [Piscirickettsia salmonis]|uniref:glutamine-hydrolyzing carbamoyl-phosphate synthase small subunit n=1 Tax=Piscirickettsia salmonis TaxID=1238 RepID=UPI0007C8BCCF|nr:Carbamoyl-phosphate synthase small chain [Piscirickettsiaceae bacterium NZ-RLO1]